MNTLTKTSLRILPGAAAALAIALSSATPASALLQGNAVSTNGIKLNALQPNIVTPNALIDNAVQPNGAQGTGAAFDFDAARVTAVTLPAEAE